MGYPMTWKRLINRNSLSDGDYGQPPTSWIQAGGATNWDVLESMSQERLVGFLRTITKHQIDHQESLNKRLAIFAGDLRRLERDTVDEGTTCAEIARRTGFDVNDVAAILKEWMQT